MSGVREDECSCLGLGSWSFQSSLCPLSKTFPWCSPRWNVLAGLRDNVTSCQVLRMLSHHWVLIWEMQLQRSPSSGRACGIWLQERPLGFESCLGKGESLTNKPSLLFTSYLARCLICLLLPFLVLNAFFFMCITYESKPPHSELRIPLWAQQILGRVLTFASVSILGSFMPSG